MYANVHVDVCLATAAENTHRRLVDVFKLSVRIDIKCSMYYKCIRANGCYVACRKSFRI